MSRKRKNNAKKILGIILNIILTIIIVLGLTIITIAILKAIGLF